MQKVGDFLVDNSLQDFRDEREEGDWSVVRGRCWVATLGVTFEVFHSDGTLACERDSLNILVMVGVIDSAVARSI